jgi:hypothetical protein
VQLAGGDVALLEGPDDDPKTLFDVFSHHSFVAHLDWAASAPH